MDGWKGIWEWTNERLEMLLQEVHVQDKGEMRERAVHVLQ